MDRLIKIVNLLVLLAVLGGGGWLFWRLTYGGPALDRGIQAMKRRQWDDAAACFAEAVQEAVKKEREGQTPVAEPFLWQGRCAGEREDWNTALSAWQEALTREPTSAEARLQLAELYRRMGKEREARREYETLLKQDAESVQAHLGLGKMAAFADRYDQAIEHYEAAWKVDHTLLEAATDLAVLYSFRDRDEEGMAVCRDAIAVREDFAPAWALLGDFHNKAREFAEARRMANTAIGHDYTLPEARITLGVACLGEKLLDAAIPQFDKALELKPDHAVAHLYLGLTRGLKGERDKARASFAEARRLLRDAKKERRRLYNPGLESIIERAEREFAREKKP